MSAGLRPLRPASAPSCSHYGDAFCGVAGNPRLGEFVPGTGERSDGRGVPTRHAGRNNR